MKAFDLEKALRGEPVITGCGIPVSEVTKNGKNELIASTSCYILYADLDGRNLDGEFKHNLFMREPTDVTRDHLGKRT